MTRTEWTLIPQDEATLDEQIEAQYRAHNRDGWRHFFKPTN